jgi:predicted nucleic acid-binding protein
VRRIIVDASVVLSGLFKDGTVRDVLLYFEGAKFIAPSFLKSEVERHLPDVVYRTGKPEATVSATLEDLFSTIDLVPAGVYYRSMAKARNIAKSAGAEGDEDYIAIALALEAPVWTLDKDFVRVAGIRTLQTSEIEESLD